jgi:hypothetical protein
VRRWPRKAPGPDVGEPLLCRHLTSLDPVTRCGKPAAVRFCVEHMKCAVPECANQAKSTSIKCEVHAVCRKCGEPSDAGWCLSCYEVSEGRLVRDTHVLGDLPRGTA